MMLHNLILEWAEDRGILTSGTTVGQLAKLEEEFKELCDAMLLEDMDEIEDAIGDMQVVLIILAQMYGLSATKALERAYKIIDKRKGKMVNGVFVKDAA